MSSNSPSISSYPDVVRALKRRWRQASVVFLASMGLVVAALVVWPRSYQSEGKLFVRPTIKHITEDPSAIDGNENISVQGDRKMEINSIVEVLRSQALAAMVVDEIGPDSILGGADESGDSRPEESETAAAMKHERATRALMKSIDVGAPTDTSLININCEASTPKMAQRIVEVLMNKYLEEHARVNRTDGAYDFFGKQAALLKTELDQANAMLRDAKNEFQLLSIEGKRQGLQIQLDTIEAEILISNRDLATSRAQITALTQAVAAQPERLQTEQISGIANNAADIMRNELFRLESREEDLAAKYTDEHPQVIAIRQQIGKMRAILGEQATQRTHVTTAPNENRRELELVLLNEKAAINAKLARSEKLQEQRTTALADLQKLNSDEVRIANLQRKAFLVETSYRKYADKLEESRMHSAMETGRISNVKIVQPPTLIYKPASPRKGTVLALGMLVSLFFAAAWAILGELQDRSLKSRREIEEQLGLPVLQSIPRVSNDKVLLNI